MTWFKMQKTMKKLKRGRKKSVHKRVDHGSALGNPLDLSTRVGGRRRVILVKTEVGPGVAAFSSPLSSSQLAALHPPISYSLSYSVGAVASFPGMAVQQTGAA